MPKAIFSSLGLCNKTQPILFFSLLCFSSLFGQKAAFDSLQIKHSTTVYFPFGQYNLPIGSDTSLIKLVNETTKYAAYQIHIEAHTDAIGGLEANQVLSLKRANTVKEWLLQNGLTDKVAIRTSPYGESQPDVDNSTAASRQLNRRATIKLYQKTAMTYVEGQIVNAETGKGIPATVILHSKVARDTLQTLPNGTFKHLVQQDIVLGLDVFAKGYFFETQMLKTKKGKMPPIKIQLPEVKKGEIVPIKNMYFVGDQAVLLPVSKPQLPKVLRFMEVNDESIIEIAGHINLPNNQPVIKSSWNFGLSVQRAKLIYDYLLANGIDSTRVTFKGYGNHQMKYPNATSEKQMSLNRRVEIRVLE